jgi:CRISPR-associated endoribonuclease Cas6
VGAFAPFILSGSKELMRLAYDCGVGEKNAAGFGMIEVKIG